MAIILNTINFVVIIVKTVHRLQCFKTAVLMWVFWGFFFKDTETVNWSSCVSNESALLLESPSAELASELQ